MPMPMEQSEWIMINGERQREEWEKNNKWLYIYTIISYIVLSPVYTTLNFWYGTDKIGTRTTFLVLGLPIFWAPFTLRSIFGTARIKLVPVPLFWFLDYLYFEPHYTLDFWYRTTFLVGTGTDFIRAVPKIERSVNGAY
jgi:hypothetical protein